MTEFEKMRNSELYDFSNKDGMKSIEHANRLCCRLQTLTLFDEDYRTIIEELIPGIPASATICPPFHCDHGHGIKVGENVFINYGATMLDEALITIGDRTLIGPNCQLVTPNHPINYMERRKPVETGFPITIGDIKVARSVDPYLDKEAVRVIAAMPQWKPGKQRGKEVRVSYTVPVIFSLDGKGYQKAQITRKNKIKRVC